MVVPYNVFCRMFGRIAAASSVMIIGQIAQAANFDHVIVAGANGSIGAAGTFSSGSIPGNNPGDLLSYNTLGIAGSVSIGSSATVGVIRNENTGALTLSAGAGTLTLDGTDLSAANQPFGSAGVAAIDVSSGGALAISSGLSLIHTDLDIGSTGSSIAISGNIAAASAQSINYRGNATSAVITDSGNIGSAGSAIAISNLGIGSATTTLSGILGPSVASVTENSANSNLLLTAANTFTGTTTVGTAGSAANGGTLTVSSQLGSINKSSGISIYGIGSNLVLNNAGGSTFNNSDRIANTAGVTLSQGGEFHLIGAGANTSTNESIGTLSLSAGAGIVTISGVGANNTQTITSTDLSRTNAGTALIRGDNLMLQPTSTSRITFGGTTAKGVTLVGNDFSSSGTVTTGMTKTLKIVPYLLGDTNSQGTGVNFVTYDISSSGGIRLLAAGEQATLSSSYTTPGTVQAPGPFQNVLAFGGVMTSSAVSVNSLLFNYSARLQILNGASVGGSSDVLTVASGAIANVTAFNNTIGSGFTGLTLGNDEGVITAAGSGSLTINAPISVTSNGGLTKTGAADVVLGAANLYTGATTINQGNLQIGNGTTGTISSASKVTVNGGALVIDQPGGSIFANTIVDNGAVSGTIASGATLTLSGDISGNGVVNQSQANATLKLSGNNSFNGGLNVSNASTLQLITNVNAAGGSAMNFSSAAGSTGPTLQLRADADTTFASGTSSVAANFMGAGVGASAFNINVDQATSAGTNHALAIGNLVYDNSSASAPDQLNVTGQHGYGLTVGNVSSSNRTGSANAFTFNPTTSNIAAGVFTGSSTANSTVTFAGSGVTTVGNLLNGTGRSLSAIVNNAGGTAILDGLSDSLNGGNIAFSSGTLLVNGSISPTGTTTVTSASRLGGAGVIGGAVTLSNGSSLTPGGAVIAGSSVTSLAGTLTTGALDMTAAIAADNGELIFDLGSSSDKVVSTGTIAIGSNALNLSDFTFNQGSGFHAGAYTLLSGTSLAGSTTSTGMVGGYSAVLASKGNDVVLTLTAIPEPTGFAVFGLAGLTMLRRCRRPAAGLGTDSM